MRRCWSRGDDNTAVGKLAPLGDDGGVRIKIFDENFGGYWGMASVLQGPGGVLQAPYLGSLRESLFDTACIIDVK